MKKKKIQILEKVGFLVRTDKLNISSDKLSWVTLIFSPRDTHPEYVVVIMLMKHLSRGGVYQFPHLIRVQAN